MQEKREDYHRQKREREEEELQKMKQVQREKVIHGYVCCKLHNWTVFDSV